MENDDFRPYRDYFLRISGCGNEGSENAKNFQDEIRALRAALTDRDRRLNEFEKMVNELKREIEQEWRQTRGK